MCLASNRRAHSLEVFDVPSGSMKTIFKPYHHNWFKHTALRMVRQRRTCTCLMNKSLWLKTECVPTQTRFCVQGDSRKTSCSNSTTSNYGQVSGRRRAAQSRLNSDIGLLLVEASCVTVAPPFSGGAFAGGLPAAGAPAPRSPRK